MSTLKAAHTIYILENELDSILRPQQLLWAPNHTASTAYICFKHNPSQWRLYGYMVEIIISINRMFSDQ